MRIGRSERGHPKQLGKDLGGISGWDGQRIDVSWAVLRLVGTGRGRDAPSAA
jgi:hypothetical protein